MCGVGVAILKEKGVGSATGWTERERGRGLFHPGAYGRGKRKSLVFESGESCFDRKRGDQRGRRSRIVLVKREVLNCDGAKKENFFGERASTGRGLVE
ncbi:hypothetical protein TNCV_2185891 [Trichonephila clavipes]|nr:hypothetical protein TNCV_2185891 [Trichonephila clavipes]